VTPSEACTVPTAASADDPRVVRALEEYIAAMEAGSPPPRDEFLTRHADVAGVLADCLFGLEMVYHAGASRPDNGAAPETDGDGVADLEPLGDFQIVREVGRGGMGVVYEAVQRSLGRRVALKVLPFAATMDPRQLQRFHNEARAAASLHHEHIVPVYAVGQERGVHFYAMQFIDGQGLDELIARQRGEPSGAPATAAPTVPLAAQTTGTARRDAAEYRRAAELIADAADALEHAHALGVVHRDVKPANLMLDAHGKLWVTDFGLARLGADAGLTMTGDLLGTLRYMSPEQALAKHNLVDHRSDVYSLGATLYELLTLRPVVDGKDREDILRRIAFEEPRPPRALDRAIPAELETIVLTALAKEPAERYATAQDLADDLRRFLGDEPIRAKRPTRPQRARKWLRRHPAVLRSALVVVLLAAVGCGIGAWLLWREQQRTLGQKIEAEKRLAQVEKANDILGSIFRDLNPAAEEKGGPALRVQLGERIDEAAGLLEGEAVGDPLNVARLQDLLGNSLRSLGQNEKALPLLEKAHLTREAALGLDHPDTLQSKHNLARLYQEQGKYGRAESLFREVLQARTAKLGDDHPSTLETKNNLALVYYDQEQYDRAEALHREVLQARTAKLGANDPVTLATKNNLALVYDQQGQYDRAEGLLQEVLQAFTIRLGDDHPDTLTVKHNLAGLYRKQGQYDRAEALFREVLRARTAKLGDDHPLALRTKHDLALVYDQQGRYDRAEALFREVLQAQRAKLGDDHRDTLTTKGMLALLYRDRGKYDQAEPLFREVLQARTAKLGDDHPSTLITKHNLALLFDDQGKHDRAESLFREVLQASTATLGADHPDTLATKAHLAVLYCRQGQYDRAAQLHQEVLQARTAKLGDDHPSTLETKNNLAALYYDQGKSDRAELLYREVLQAATAKLGAHHPHTLVIKNNLANAYKQQGKYDRAEPLLKEVLQAYMVQLGAEHPSTLTVKYNLATLYYYQGQYDRAEPLYREVLQARAAKLGDEHPDTLVSKSRLGMVYLALGKYAQAEPLLRECLAIREKKEPDAWRTFNARSLLGGALLGQQKYAEAEPLLLQGYDGMKQREASIPAQGKVRLSEALERLVQLYDAWGKKDKADEWRSNLRAEQARKEAQEGRPDKLKP
jgi:serine/threonine protein kinase/lipopolysaccharide biosynthesis regulator YciM